MCARDALSKSKYRDQFFTENCEENDSHTSDSIRHLHRLQQRNLHLTSAYCPLVSLSGTQDNRAQVSSSSHAGAPIENGQDDGMSFSHLL